MDDSAVVCEVMRAVLGADRNIKVIVAADPLIAFAKIEREQPHVVVTDLEMPRMDGLTFIRTIMAHQPLPIVVCSGSLRSGWISPFQPFASAPSK